MNNLKQWLCRNKHILGLIQWNGNDVPQLLIYRHSMDMNDERPADVDVMLGPVIGRLPVKCEICEDVKLWDSSVDAIAELILNLSNEQMAKLQAVVAKRQARTTRERMYAAE